MTEQIPTTEKLAAALEKAGMPVAIIVAARTGFYDDFHENGHTFPQMALVNALTAVGTPAARAFRKRAIDGEFDAQKWESDAWAAKQTGETGKIIDDLGMR